jgi:hypothetical protein
MFNKEGYEKLGEDIYVYHKFVSNEICDLVCKDAELIKDEDWEAFHFERYMSKVTGSPHIKKIKDSIGLILKEGLNIGNGLAVHKMKKGSYFHAHSDNYGFTDIIKASEMYVDGEEFDLVKNNVFGIIVYLNDFEGGEIEYVNQNIKYKPIKGDLLIHGAHNSCEHKVNEVLSEIRYVYPNNVFEFLKVPKGFKNVI